MCTSILAGKKATANGSMIIARNEDYTKNNWNKYLKPLRDPQYATDKNCVSNDFWTLGNGLKVPVPQKKFRYCSSPDAEDHLDAVCSTGDHYLFEARGFNEKNVMMSATNSMEINEKAYAADHTAETGIEESVIPALILPQAETALEAVRLLGWYVEQFGAAEANGIAFADKQDLWYMEIGSCRHWIAVRVPQNCYLAVSNCMRIRGADLDDTENVQCSSGLYDFTAKNHLLAKPDRNHFDFASAFGYYGKSGENADPYYNVDRLWLAQHLLTPSLKQQIRQEEYPLFLKPDQKITVQMTAEVLRADYEGTLLEHLSHRPIGVAYTAESHIMEMNPSMPAGFEGTIWQTTGTPLGCPYMPLYPFMEKIPSEYALGNSDYDAESAYWDFRGLFSIASCMGTETAGEIRRMWALYEKELFREYENFRQFLKKTAADDPRAAAVSAENYSTRVLLQTAQTAKDKRTQLLTQMSVRIK